MWSLSHILCALSMFCLRSPTYLSQRSGSHSLTTAGQVVSGLRPGRGICIGIGEPNDFWDSMPPAKLE